MKKIIALLLCVSLIGFPCFAGRTTEQKGKSVGGNTGLVVGATAGVLLSSFIPGVGFVIGNAIGVAGTLIGQVIGQEVGSSIGRAMTDIYSESPIFKIRTNIRYELAEGTTRFLYSDAIDNSAISIIGNQATIEIDMTPSIIDKEADILNSDIRIPVIIQMEISDSVNTKIVDVYSAGIADLTKTESGESGIVYYGEIEATENTNKVSVKLETQDSACSVQVNVLYGASGEKVLVSEDSNASAIFNFDFVDSEQIENLDD